MIVWSSVTLSTMRLSSEVAKKLTLWYLYGVNTVAHDHLSIVRVKPELIVSNGDVLKGWGPFHFLISVSLWLPTTFVVLIVLFKCFTPEWWGEQSQNRGRTSPGAAGMASTLVMFFCIPGGLGFMPAVCLGLAAAVLGLFWLRASVQESAGPF